MPIFVAVTQVNPLSRWIGGRIWQVLDAYRFHSLFFFFIFILGFILLLISWLLTHSPNRNRNIARSFQWTWWTHSGWMAYFGSTIWNNSPLENFVVRPTHGGKKSERIRWKLRQRGGTGLAVQDDKIVTSTKAIVVYANNFTFILMRKWIEIMEIKWNCVFF